ncbi:alginate lyase family protein [Halomonas salinarum]|uniref:alginate lyase family protein n=1 Tax=Halomonas salinarum TaxID=1158993 RepID=UPI0014388816|nr:alginate lyase family protein [Halomonas salinarum]
MPHAVAKGLTIALMTTMASINLAADTSSRSTMSTEEREDLNLSEYRVTDTNASYFDVNAVMPLLQQTDNALLLQLRDNLSTGPSCRQKLNSEPITTRGAIPSFYPRPDAWELATGPIFGFEDSVSTLAGAYVASSDPYYAECLVHYLHGWAEAEALTAFVYDSARPQAWFASESMLFAAAMAYSVVRPFIDGLEEERADIEQWLHGLALEHSSIHGHEEDSCCNNHLYRRALYASMIGVLVEDDDLFRFGVKALYSALHDMTEEGALPHEVRRGRRATHYQNYALSYLITNMQVIHRQGYDIFNLEYEGSNIHEAVDYLFQILDDPAALGDYAPLEQYTGFLRDPQYFTWMEIYLSHFDHPKMASLVTRIRPAYNRSAGGHITLYFMDPSAQQHIYTNERRRDTEAFRGLNN